jgi:glycerol-3-phosphate dehydrogenase
MWDDVLAVEVLRSASLDGAAVANYVEAVTPLWTREQVRGYLVRDRESGGKSFELRAHSTVFCGGPWNDELGQKLSEQWKESLNPSKGVHLVFDSHRLDVPGALVMSHRSDGRIVFVIPRRDLGDGVTIVGTTDGPVAKGSNRPDDATVEREDVDYLLTMLNHYFPELGLSQKDIISSYVGVRPLMREQEGASLQKVSREHFIGRGPGGITFVVGGKYTTHRIMARDIVDQALKHWVEDAAQGLKEKSPPKTVASHTERSPNPKATHEAIARARLQAEKDGLRIPEKLWDRYGAEAVELPRLQPRHAPEDPPGFPMIAAQLRFCIRTGMVMHLEDFFLRRVPLFLARADHGEPWIEALGRVWAEETMSSETQRDLEIKRLRAEIARCSFESKW